MILRYGGRNFHCFKEDFEIDLRLNKNCPEDISGGKDCSSVMCIKGANASGKTNALKALSFLASFISKSFNIKPEGDIGVETYFHNLMETQLFCEFRVDNVDYRYDLTLKSNVVVQEKLVLISEPNTPLFHRLKNEVNTDKSEYSALLAIPKIRSNASLISIANQYEIKCISDFYSFFVRLTSNVGYTGYTELLSPEGTSKLHFNNPEIFEFVKKQLKKFDTGIIDIEIDFYNDIEENKVYFPVFSFIVDGNIKKLRMKHQSSGTRRLYTLLALFVSAGQKLKDEQFSSILILDELDLHLHSLIIPELVGLFENNLNTQLIFTCQNDQILDHMGKYRTTFINKENNESYSYRLDEIPSDLLRNNRPITPHYKKGSIGGVPNIGK